MGDVSRSEAAAYIAFLAKGKTRQDWEELGSEEQVKMVPSSVEVTSLVGPSQQRIWILEDFLMDDMVNEPKWENLPEGIGLWIERCFKVKAPMAIHMEECALQTIEQTLLHPYPKLPIKLKRKCNIGHIFHGIVELCQYHCPHPWTDHCCVLDPTDEVVQLQKEQQKAHLFLAVVSSQTHWALLAASKNDVDASGVAQAVVYDGDFLDVIQKGCEEWLARVEAQQGLTFKLTMAEVPKQEDTWSCGHRCLLAANRVLSALFEYREPLPKKFDESFASDADLKALCSNVLVRPPVPPKLETKSEPLKHERLALPGHVIVKRQKPDDEVAAVAQQMSHSKPGHSAGSHECDPARGPTASSSNGQRDDAGDARMADADATSCSKRQRADAGDAHMADAADVAPAPSTPPARKRALPEDESPVGKQEKKRQRNYRRRILPRRSNHCRRSCLAKAWSTMALGKRHMLRSKPCQHVAIGRSSSKLWWRERKPLSSVKPANGLLLCTCGENQKSNLKKNKRRRMQDLGKGEDLPGMQGKQMCFESTLLLTEAVSTNQSSRIMVQKEMKRRRTPSAFITFASLARRSSSFSGTQ